MQGSEQTSRKSRPSFDLRDPGNFEARLRAMIAAQDSGEQERQRIQRKAELARNLKTGTYSEKTQRLRQAIEAAGYKHRKTIQEYQPNKRYNYAKQLKELRQAVEADKKRAEMNKLNLEEIKRRLEMGEAGRKKAKKRKREEDSEQIQKKKKREDKREECDPVPFTSRATSVLTDRPGGPGERLSSSSSASDISLLDAQLNELLGFGSVETGRKKAKKRKREEDSEQIQKKKKREDEREECAPVPFTSRASSVLTDRPGGPGGRLSSSSSASDISLLDDQLNELLGLGPVETDRKKDKKRKREDDSEQIQKKKKREDEREECAPVPSTSRASSVLTDRPGGPGERLSSSSSASDISLLDDQLNELLGLGPVETDRKKDKKRKREEDSEQIQKKKKREDEREECDPVPFTSRATSVLTDRPGGPGERLSSSSSASDISLLDDQLYELLGLGPVETGRKSVQLGCEPLESEKRIETGREKAEESKRKEYCEERKRVEERDIGAVPSTSRSSPKRTIIKGLIMMKMAKDVQFYHSYCKKTPEALPVAGPTRRKPRYKGRV
ncbi:eukaryotic translation initiation factor 5B-like [Astyanax mexicanus]|uniref:eukaryotic translation initiation factor 5B-like n=1 Tax=Astyanax mexicanus TaxID=7994 RepID=UPI0020CB3AE1|nr:eukaryotic translation initiation factor 5B-like [Astyanax mexicanus]